jgi:hypothetical protein
MSMEERPICMRTQKETMGANGRVLPLFPMGILVPVQPTVTLPLALSQFLSGLDWPVSGCIFHMWLTQLSAWFCSLAWLTLQPENGDNTFLQNVHLTPN